jgi:hypothetical protein
VRLVSSALGLSLVAALVAVVLSGRHAGATEPAPVSSGLLPGSYNALTQGLVFDSRSGLNTASGALAPNTQRVATVLGRAGVPATNVSAVAVTITAVSATAAGSLTVWADGAAKPGTSSVSFLRGVSTSDLAVVQVSSGGQIRFSNNSPGTVHVVGAIAGYYVGGTPSAPGSTAVIPQVRALDTRTTLGGHQAPVAPNSGFSVPIGGHAVPANAAAAIVTVSALSPAASGTVTAWKTGTTRPGTVNLELIVGRTMSDLVVVPLGTNGAISIWNNSARALHLIVDVDGYVLGGSGAEGGTTTAGAPARALDTRTTIGGHLGALPAFGTYALPIAGLAGVPATNVTAVVATITVVGPPAAGGVTVWADGGFRPSAGAMSFAALQSTSALVVAPVGSDGKIDLYNNSAAGLQVVVDVAAYVRADRQPVLASTSRYVRNLTATQSDATVMQSEGCADAQSNNAARALHVQLLHIGGQNMIGGTYGVQLSAVSQTLTDAQLVTAVNGYVDGYASCRTNTDPVYIVVATNNDGDLRDSAAGKDWADNVIDKVAAHAAGAAGLVVAGANDIEPDFFGTEAEAEAWTTGFVANTSAPYLFTGAASGCSSTAVAGTCNWGWTQRNFYNLAHGLSPTRILALPQIYYTVNAAQWKYISLAGASGPDRISFVGALSEYAACQTPGSGCDLKGLLTPVASWQALRSALSSSAAVSLQRLPVSTDLRTDTLPSAPVSAKRVTTAGVS